MPDSEDAPDISMPGYKLAERLGSGGYGEVWRAEVPGGIQKAVKIVFGRYDQQRAASEMRAMERVKSLRHPFLLSLERIEIFESRLVIVTELADGSLRDRFQECRSEGLPGIPRDELLGYLADAADALDFICEQHDLQHLDVKPENLLLVAGRVKLADFGLVKDLYTTQASIVGGMTPSYAAPELFQGRPSARSDQYSLAILYQELLTGTLPFAGQTAAELTLQHMHESPNLDALDEGDRFAISQALAKGKDHRFDNCKAFIAALSDPARHESQQTQEPKSQVDTVANQAQETSFSNASTAPPSHSVTQVFDESDAGWTAKSAPVLFELPAAGDCELQAASIIEDQLSASEFCPTPAVVIGIGGTAMQVMRALREQMATAYGGSEALAAINMMLIDTDPQTIGRATRDSHAGLPLAPTETLSTPLKRPQDYRSSSSRLLKWMSRRWLYNIPRSLRSDGIRPLGRLALIDHARQVCQRIRLLLQQAVDPQRISEAEQVAGIKFRTEALRVYLVGGISGGTSSGTLLDIAYIVRAALDRMEIQDTKVIGLATHATSGDLERGELARVNAFSWLSELQHFSNPAITYPGDEGVGLPSHAREVSPFDSTYIVNMGHRIDQSTFVRQTDAVASYLFVDMFTPAQEFLDASRKKQTDESSMLPPGVRTFAIRSKSKLSPDAIEYWTTALQRLMIGRWCGARAGLESEAAVLPKDSTFEKTTGRLVPGAPQFVSQQQLDVTGLAALGKSAVEQQLGGDAVQLLRTAAVDAGFSPQTLTIDGGLSLIETLVQTSSDQEQLTYQARGTSTGEIADKVAAERCAELGNWILSLVGKPGERLGGAEQAILWFRDHFASLAGPIGRLRESLQQEFETLANADSDNESESIDVGRRVVRLLRIRIDQTAIAVAEEVLGQLQLSLQAASTRLDRIHKVLDHASDGLGFSALDPEGNPESKHDEALKQPQSGLAINQLITEVDARIEESLIAQDGKLLALLEAGDAEAQLSALMEEAARQTVLGSPTVRRLAAELAPSAASGDEMLQSEGLTPVLHEQGGQFVRLRICPQYTGSSETNVQLPEGEACFPTTFADTYEIAEAWDLSVVHVAAEFVDYRRDYAQLASRIHTRTDIDWPSLLEIETPSEAGCSVSPLDGSDGSEIIATQVISPEADVPT